MMNDKENGMVANNDTSNENRLVENETRNSDSTSEANKGKNENRETEDSNNDSENSGGSTLTNDEIRNLMSHGGFNSGINPEALNKLMNQPSPDTKALLDRVSNIIEIQDGNIQRAYNKIGNLENQITALKVVSKFNSIIAIASIIVAIVAIILG
jgi:hypothetical protein